MCRVLTTIITGFRLSSASTLYRVGQTTTTIICPHSRPDQPVHDNYCSLSLSRQHRLLHRSASTENLYCSGTARQIHNYRRLARRAGSGQGDWIACPCILVPLT